MPAVTAQQPTGLQPGAFLQYELDRCYDEMFDGSGVPRAPYDALHRRLLELPSS